HHVERGAVHRLVRAQPVGGSDGDRCGSEGADDAVLAAHVMGGGQHVAEGRTADDQLPSVTIGNSKCEVGATARDQLEGEGRSGPRVLDQPRSHSLLVQPTHRRHGSRAPAGPYDAAVAEVALTPTSYVVLGLVGARGPLTPYEMKQFVARSIGYFWP